MRVEERIIGAWADQLANRVVKKTVAALKKMGRDCMLSGDSGLKNVWEEVCVQVQSEYSVDWDTYETVIDDLLASYASELERSAVLALWATTDEGSDWMNENCVASDGYEEVPFSIGAIAEQLRGNVLSIASDYKSPAVRRYLRRADDCLV